MEIPYCPNCGKAGLRWRNPQEERTPHMSYITRYCPRCKKWVYATFRGVATHARPGKPRRFRCR